MGPTTNLIGDLIYYQGPIDDARHWSPDYRDHAGLSTVTWTELASVDGGLVTHALMTTQLTEVSGASLGDAMALVERVESVRGSFTAA